MSMDGKGRCLDNVFVERLWRTVKYEDVYLWRHETVPELHAGLSTVLRRTTTEDGSISRWRIERRRRFMEWVVGACVFEAWLRYPME